MASVLNQPYFHDEAGGVRGPGGDHVAGRKARALPALWRCGKANRLAVQTSKPSKRNPEGKPVYGLWKCYACRKQFTVRKGTIFEESRLELHLWFQAAFLMCSSKKGVSANQLHRTLGCTLKTAWFVAHRMREAMAEGRLDPFGSAGGAVESDEAFLSRRRRKGDRPLHKQKKMKVLDPCRPRHRTRP